MPLNPPLPRLTAFLVVMLRMSLGIASAQAYDVTATVKIVGSTYRTSTTRMGSPEVVFWLTPESMLPPRPRHYRIVQKDKHFDPHLLVLPVGSSVEFPNQDTFFHNVFSLFDGKRFDLGLYEAGSTRTVQFNHEGVSYLFCNIHSEMSAVVIALSTPYFAVASPEGRVLIRNVPPGTYQLAIWSHSADPSEMKSLGRKLQVGPGSTSLGEFRIRQAENAATHKNKFGEDYPAPSATTY